MLAEFVKHIPIKFMKQKGRLYNLYMFISLLGYKHDHITKNKYGIMKAYKVINIEALAEWFVKSELRREHEDKFIVSKDDDGNVILDDEGKPTYITYPSTNKKDFSLPVKVANPFSYYTASHDARHEASGRTIIDRLLRDMSHEIKSWLVKGYIQQKGKAATQAQKENSIVEYSFADAISGEEYSAEALFNGSTVEYDHKVPTSKGGTGKDIRPIAKSTNRKRSNKDLLSDK